MSNWEAIKQVEQLCAQYDRSSDTALADQVSNSRNDFDQKLKDVSSIIPFKWSKTEWLQTTLDGVLRGMVPKIQQDANHGCYEAAKAIQEATINLRNQSSIDRYVLAHQASTWSRTSETAGLWQIRNYASWWNLGARMRAAWLE